MKKFLIGVFVVALGIGIFHGPALRAVTALYNSTITIVSSTGANIVTGTASALTALPNQTVRVVNSSNQVMDTLGGTGSSVQFSPDNYGAKGNLVIAYDGAMAAIPSGNASSTAPSAPTYTTTQQNDYVLSVYGVLTTWSAVPATPTQRVNTTGGADYGNWAGDQLVATAGSVGAQAGTLNSSTNWEAGTIPLFPASGQSIAFVNPMSHQQASGATLTLTPPTGTTSGMMEIACVSWYNGSPGNTITNPSTFFAWPVFYNIKSNNVFQCQAHFFVTGETSYVWTQTYSAGGMSGFILTYSGVGGVDDPLTTSATTFTSADALKLIGVENTKLFSNLSLSNGSGTILSYPVIAAHQVYVNGLSNASGSALSSAEYRYASDDKVAINAAETACQTAGGGTVVFAKGYGSSDGILLPTSVSCNQIGQFNTIPWWALGNSGTAVKCQYYNGSEGSCAGTPGTSIGSGIDFLSDSMTTGGMSLTCTAGATCSTIRDTIQGLTLWGGAGLNWNGLNSADGIFLQNVQHAFVARNYIFGFGRDGIRVASSTGAANWAGFNHIQGNYISLNGEYGINLIGGDNVQNTTVDGENEVETNLSSGLNANLTSGAGGATSGVLDVNGNVFQWNNFDNTGPTGEVEVTGPCPGCVIQTNWIEIANFNTDAFIDSGTAATTQGASFKDNNVLLDQHGTRTAKLGTDSSHIITGGQYTNNSGATVTGFYDNTAVTGVTSALQAAGISGGGALSTGSNGFAGTITGLAATGNVFTPGYYCPNAVVMSLTDDTTPGGCQKSASSTTTFTFTCTASDTAEYVAGCR